MKVIRLCLVEADHPRHALDSRGSGYGKSQGPHLSFFEKDQILLPGITIEDHELITAIDRAGSHPQVAPQGKPTA